MMPLRFARLVLLGAALTGAACEGCGPVDPLTGAKAELRLTPPSLDFPATYVSQTAQLSLMVDNVGQAPASLTNAALSGPNADQFVVGEPPLERLAAGETATVTIGYLPSVLGEVTATFSFDTDIDEQPSFSVALAAEGRAVPNCDDDNECTDDLFDFDAEECTNTQHQRDCNDGSDCTEGDRCTEGLCVGQVVACPAGSECQAPACTNDDGCVLVDIPGACEDDNPCTEDVCTETGCENNLLPDDTACAENVPCVETSRCEAGVCLTEPVQCTPPAACFSATCDAEAGGCVFVPEPGACDDGDPCTDDICTANGCDNPQKPEGATCGPFTECVSLSLCLGGACTEVEIPDGTPCFDNDYCTIDDICMNDACVGTPYEGDPAVAQEVFTFGSLDAGSVAVSDTEIVIIDRRSGGLYLTSIDTSGEELQVAETYRVDVPGLQSARIAWRGFPLGPDDFVLVDTFETFHFSRDGAGGLFELASTAPSPTGANLPVGDADGAGHVFWCNYINNSPISVLQLDNGTISYADDILLGDENAVCVSVAADEVNQRLFVGTTNGLWEYDISGPPTLLAQHEPGVWALAAAAAGQVVVTVDPILNNFDVATLRSGATYEELRTFDVDDIPGCADAGCTFIEFALTAEHFTTRATPGGGQHFIGSWSLGDSLAPPTGFAMADSVPSELWYFDRTLTASSNLLHLRPRSLQDQQWLFRLPDLLSAPAAPRINDTSRLFVHTSGLLALHQNVIHHIDTADPPSVTDSTWLGTTSALMSGDKIFSTLPPVFPYGRNDPLSPPLEVGVFQRRILDDGLAVLTNSIGEAFEAIRCGDEVCAGLQHPDEAAPVLRTVPPGAIAAHAAATPGTTLALGPPLALEAPPLQGFVQQDAYRLGVNGQRVAASVTFQSTTDLSSRITAAFAPAGALPLADRPTLVLDDVVVNSVGTDPAGTTIVAITAPSFDVDGDTFRTFRYVGDSFGEDGAVVLTDANHLLAFDGIHAFVSTRSGMAFIDVGQSPPVLLAELPLDEPPIDAAFTDGRVFVSHDNGVWAIEPPCPLPFQ